MAEYAVRITWEGHGYPKYIKRDPEDHSVALEDENRNIVLTRLIDDALHLSSYLDMLAERSMVLMELGEDFGGEVNIVNLRRGNE